MKKKYKQQESKDELNLIIEDLEGNDTTWENEDIFFMNDKDHEFMLTEIEGALYDKDVELRELQDNLEGWKKKEETKKLYVDAIKQIGKDNILMLIYLVENGLEVLRPYIAPKGYWSDGNIFIEITKLEEQPCNSGKGTYLDNCIRYSKDRLEEYSSINVTEGDSESDIFLTQYIKNQIVSIVKSKLGELEVVYCRQRYV